MGATLNTIANLLKEVYQGDVREQVNQETILLERITRSGNVTTDIGGKYVTFPIHTGRNSGIGSRGELEALPTPGQQSFAAARVGLKYGYGGVQLSGQAIALSETNTQAFTEILDYEIAGLKQDLAKDMNRQLYGSGNGAIGTLTATATSATQTVGDARYFQVGEVLDQITLPNTVVATNLVVQSVNLSANQVTFTTSVTGTTGQIFARKGSGPDGTATNREITGLSAIVDNSSTVFNLSPGTTPEWTSEVNSNSGTLRSVSESLFIQMVDRIRIRGGKSSLIVTSLGVRRAYFNLLSQTRQTVNSTTYTGGFKGLAFTTDMGDVPFLPDPDATLNRAYVLNEKNFTFYRDEPWHFLDRDGSMWKQVRDTNGDYDAWYARITEYHELACDRRNTQGRIDDLQEG